MHSIVSSVLVAAIALAGTSSGIYPTTWDLSDLFESTDAWYATCDDLTQSLDDFSKVTSPKALDALDESFWEQASRLYVYSELILSLNPTDSDGLALSSQYDSLEDAYFAATSGFYEDDGDSEFLSGILSDVSDAYDSLTYVEIPALEASADLENPYKPFLNTYAALLNAKMQSSWAYAHSLGYSSTLECALDRDEVSQQAYALTFDAYQEHLPDFWRYVELRRSASGDAENALDLYGNSPPVSDYSETFLYDEAVGQVLAALSPLGEDYVEDLNAFAQSGHVDVYPTETKPSYSFSLSTGANDLPYVLLSFTGTTSDVSTIAHEFGHAMYDYYTDLNQSYSDSFPTTYVHEVVSITNEFLYYMYRIQNAQSDEERLYLLDDALYNVYFNLLYCSAALGKLEESLYSLTESNGSITAGTISDMYAATWQELFGSQIELNPEDASWWPAEAHLFTYDYYLFEYATACMYAANLAQQIFRGDASVVNAYRTFLTLGNTLNSEMLLRTAGVDPGDSKTYEAAFDLMNQWLDQYESLVATR